ncbi:hypothetical protein CISIN_1g035139mg [Citrus sinensis]|uniref:Uncharacterized protein n=1 Tax=Citrus sinensis TaxID=2711 RepID=A0A067DDK7_CITSI|nr:hypothetical protein CISIN_1g035139mg [Citrus sinensis]
MHIQWYYFHVKHNLNILLLIMQIPDLIKFMIIINCPFQSIPKQCYFNYKPLSSVIISTKHHFHGSINEDHST